MYTFGSAINRQGAITIPRTPVIRPPVRKLISLGRAFEKSYEGLTMLAATLTDRVATASVKSAKTTTSGLSNFPVSVTGSQMGAPYTFCVAAELGRNHDPEDTGDQAARAEADQLRKGVREVVRGAHDVGRHVDGQGGDRQREEREDHNQRIVELSRQRHRIPDGRPVHLLRGRRARAQSRSRGHR